METWKLLALIAVVFAVVYYVRGSSVSDGEESWSAESWQVTALLASSLQTAPVLNVCL